MKIRALRVRPGCNPEAVEIDDGLESLQREVEGYIELVRLDDGVDAFVNEEGVLKGLPFNRVLPAQGFNEVRMVPVVGNIIIVGNDDEGETASLTEEQERLWSAILQWPAVEAV